MDELAKQVKSDLLRTLLWTVISLGAAIAVVFLAW
jgi:hypothetical protein